MTENTAQGNDIVAAATTAVVTARKQGYGKLQEAVETVRSLNLRTGVPSISPMVSVIEEIKDAGEDEAMYLARLVNEGQAFERFVTENIDGLAIGNVYKDIAANYASIRADAKEAVEHAASGNEGFLDKITSFFKESTKGTVAERFAEIVETFLSANEKLKTQVKKETQVLDAYKLFRLAQGQGVVVALEFKRKHEELLEAAKEAEVAAQAAVDASTGTDVEKAALMAARDAAIDERKKRTKFAQSAKDIAEDVSNAHNVSDLIMKEAENTIENKDRVYKRGVSFITMNQSTIAAFSMSYTAKIGLADGVNALEAMTGGMNDSLNDLADISGKVNERAIKAGYGTTIDPNAVERFAAALIGEMEQSAPLVEKYRGESEQASNRIADIVEQTRKRTVELANRSAA
jgi:hypothetical protein